MYNHYDPHGEGTAPKKLGGFFIKTKGDESSSHGDASHRPDDREDWVVEVEEGGQLHYPDQWADQQPKESSESRVPRLGQDFQDYHIYVITPPATEDQPETNSNQVKAGSTWREGQQRGGCRQKGKECCPSPVRFGDEVTSSPSKKG